jgi:hypothetical protein
MNILNKEVCELKIRYEIHDKEAECYGYGDSEKEAWEDLEESLWDFAFDAEIRGDYVSDRFKGEYEALKKRVGVDKLPRDEYVSSLLQRIGKLEGELWDEQQKGDK